MKIFWSWQSDTAASSGRHFVKAALEQAIKQVAQELDLSQAERPEIDHDTKGVAGLAPIADTIFEKIDAAALVVADVTLTGTTPAGKKTPNPNVLIELGYAFKSRGSQRIVLIANEAGGFRNEDLPFDLRHRRGPITYELAEGASKEIKAKVEKELVANLASAIRQNLTALPAPSAPGDPVMQPSVAENRAIWFDPEHVVKLHDDVERRLYSGHTLAYLRVVPAGWKGQKPTRLAVQGARISPFGVWRNGSAALPNQLGIISGGWIGNKEAEVTALTQWFDKTGEIWGVAPGYGFERNGKIFLATDALAKQWRATLKEWIAFFDQFEARKPYRVEAGLTGMTGVHWPSDRFFESPQCMDPEVIHVQSSADWSNDAQLRFLVELFGKVCDSFCISRLTPEQVASMAV